AVSSTNQAAFKQQAADAKAALVTRESEGAVAKDAYNASLAAVQAKISTLESRLSAASMERDKEIQMRADKERELERIRIELADLKGQLAAASANDTLQTKLIDAMRQDIDNARTQYLGKLKRRMYRGQVDATTAPAAGMDVYANEPQPIGTVVNAAPRPGGGYEFLAVLQSSSVEEGAPLRLGAADGPLAGILPLPYTV
ncbi:MAG: hypothetical protein EBS65_07790, partial [Betaproteobacteria bacterium]|nr:hypothetical protein [Betaproteobacteria bacterium]